MTALDNVKVKIAFSADPSTSSPTWVDVTDRVRMDAGITITRGRHDQFSDVSPGSVTLTLDNTDGHLTPGNASSPYYPNVKPRNRIWVYYNDSPFTWSRFDGYVEAWPVSWPLGGEAESTVTITAYDLSAYVSRRPALGSIIAETYGLQDVAFHFPLSEAAESTTATDIVGGGVLRVAQAGSGGTLEFGAGTGPGTDGATAVVLTPASAGNGKYLTADFPFGRAEVATSTIAVTFATTESSRDVTVFELASGDGTYSVSAGVVGSNGRVFFEQRIGATTTTQTPAGAINDGETHTVVAVNYADAGVHHVDWYLDGSFVNTFDLGPTPGGTYPPVWRYLHVGNGTRDNPSAPYTYGIFAGTLSHVAGFTNDPGASGVADMHEANVGGFAGDTVDARIARCATWLDLDPVFLDLAACASTVGVVDSSGMDPWGYMQLCATSEAGMLYVATNGKITLLDRSRLWEYDAATYLTVTADEVGEDLMPTLGLQAIVNAATVTRERGGDAIAQDTGSITAYGKFGQTVTVALDDDAAARDLAEWIVAGYATPRPFIPNLVLDGLASSVASTVRLIDINDRVSVTSLPSQAPPDVGDLRVEGYTERIGAAGWSVECNTVPFLTLTPLVLDDATFGLLDDDNRLTY